MEKKVDSGKRFLVPGKEKKRFHRVNVAVIFFTYSAISYKPLKRLENNFYFSSNPLAKARG